MSEENQGGKEMRTVEDIKEEIKKVSTESILLGNIITGLTQTYTVLTQKMYELREELRVKSEKYANP